MVLTEGPTIRRKRRKMITGKQEYIERRIAMLEAQLAELNKYGDDIYSNGTVLRFKKRFDGRGGQW